MIMQAPVDLSVVSLIESKKMGKNQKLLGILLIKGRVLTFSKPANVVERQDSDEIR